jgi:hypothetical protein
MQVPITVPVRPIGARRRLVAGASTTGCFARRNCNVDLGDLRWDCPLLDCEPQQARASLAILNWTRHVGLAVIPPGQPWCRVV